MLDFRYHALSLVAVFLALAIGIVLGVTIGDSLLSDAERSLRGDLRASVLDARSDEAAARSELSGRDRMLEQLYPELVDTRLEGVRVALVSWGPLPDDVESGVRDAVEEGGGRLDSVSVFNEPLSMIEGAVGEEEFAVASADETSLKSLGRSLSRSLLGGGRVAEALRDESPEDLAGAFRGADAVVFHEAPRPEDPPADDKGLEERQDERARTIESAMVDEFLKRTIAVVGVEAMGAEESQIQRYKSLEISSSDAVDKAGGRIALVFALSGAEGHFGFKPSADQPLPDEALTP